MTATATSATLIGTLGILTTAVIYGTDVFAAIVLRPAARDAADSSVADLVGRIHHYGDQRLPIPGIAGILTATYLLDRSPDTLPRAAAAMALLALLTWLALYMRISAPINKRLRAAASSHTVPNDTRTLQQRWDSVIGLRAALQTLALLGLLLATINQ